MYFFVSKKRSGKGKEPDIRVTNSYLEIEMPIDDDSSIFTYIVPRSERSVFVLICLDDMFDTLMNELDNDSFETISDTWPTLAELLMNGAKDKYKSGALIRFEDADYGDNKWFVASVAGNISFESEDEIFGDRTMEALEVVMERTKELLTELQEREPSMLKAVGKGILAGLGLGLLSGAAQAFGIDIDDS